jgi:O-antigen ligase
MLVIAIPLAISPMGEDRFRTPKDALFIAGVSVCAPLFLFWCFARKERFSRWWRRSMTIKLFSAVIVWTFVVCLLSTDPLLSMPSLVWLTISATFFLAIWRLGANRKVSALALVIAPGVINAIIVGLQWLQIWSPVEFEPHIARKSTLSALLGNPNEVGTFLTIPFIVSLAMVTAVSSMRLRWVYGALAGIMVIGIVLSQSLGAAVAAMVGGVAVAIRFAGRKAVVISLLISLSVGALLMTVTPLGDRISLVPVQLAAGAYDTVFSGRVGATLAAGLMVADYPLTGLGPGRFPYHYFEYRMRAEERFGHYLVASGVNFGEVHNDHLEIAAESGLPGYVLYLMALVLLARSPESLNHAGRRDERARVVIALAAPLAITIGVLTLVQFPLQIAAPTVVILFVTALLRSWAELE